MGDHSYYYETGIKVKTKSHVKIKKNFGSDGQNLESVNIIIERWPYPTARAVSATNVQGRSALPSVVLTENWSKDDEIKNLTNKSRNTGIKRLVPVIPRSARCLFIGTRHLVCLENCTMFVYRHSSPRLFEN